MKSLIPVNTGPLVKAIRTIEGVGTVVVGAVLVIGTSIDPHRLPPKYAALLGTIMGGALIAQRGLIKVAAILKGVGVEDPIDPFDPAAVTAAQTLVTDAAGLAGFEKPESALKPDGAPGDVPLEQIQAPPTPGQ